ncbi:galectin-8 isoform X2 [Bombina bombina]|uniref:galectin-8 isoform X2 n=1 Tax=Bombina bombina TaxID=8345 RepID=UPI00235B28AE|nr:galectin-8 isoform X2 [Bombina bombina]
MSSTELQRTIQHPIVPFVGTILGGLVPEQMVIVHGCVPTNSQRFQIDFQCGSSVQPRADVAFHFNPRFSGSGVIVCNTLKDGKWGWEEKTYERPFVKGKPFEIIFMVFPDKFQVATNGKHLLVYKHRLNLERVDTLSISGQVKIDIIGFTANTSPQGSQAVSLSMRSLGGNPTVPYTGTLPIVMGAGRTVVVKGEVNKNAKLFAIDLKPSDSKDIALHLNPRMKQKLFVRNTYLYDSWGEEENQLNHFPFSPEMYFELIIYCEAQKFKVAVNGVHLFEYKHRYKDLSKINTITINGDVQLVDVRGW